MTTSTILNTVKENRIGTGTKISTLAGNHIAIFYPASKQNQYHQELAELKGLCGLAVTGCTRIVGYVKNNKGCINITVF